MPGLRDQNAMAGLGQGSSPGAACRQQAAMVTDPVCAMAVEAGDGPHLAFEGRVFWFCSAHCRDEFREAPERFPQGGENAHNDARH